MLNVHAIRKSLAVLGAIVLCTAILNGCGGDRHDKKDKEKRSALGAEPGLKQRFVQLGSTLDQLERESNIQKQKISSAKNELQAIHDMLAQSKMEELGLAEFATTGVAVVPAYTPKTVTSDVDHKEAARNSVFGTLTIIFFGLFTIVYLGKLWKDREYAPSTVAKPASDPVASSSYYTPASDGGTGESSTRPPGL